MPPDLRSARVYFSCLGGEPEREKAAEALRRAAGYLRGEVGRRCQLRYAPELHFVTDLSLERGARIEEILHQVLPPTDEAGEPPGDGGDDSDDDEEKP
jgi:ribosome-binding factor A